MKKTKTLAATITIALILFTPSLFADERHRGRTDRYPDASRTVSVEGRVRDIDRERNGFVIELDRGRHRVFARVNTPVQATGWARSHRRERVRDLERGDVIRVSGVSDRQGRIYAERILLIGDEDRRRDRDDRYLRGRVQQVDARRGILWVEADRANRIVSVDARGVDRNLRFDIRQLRRGDYVVIRGDWQRDGEFEAERIELDRVTPRW